MSQSRAPAGEPTMGNSRKILLLVALIPILVSQHINAEQDLPSVSSPNYHEQPENERPVTKPEVDPNSEINRNPEVNLNTGVNSNHTHPSTNPGPVNPNPEVQHASENPTPGIAQRTYDPQQDYRDYLQNYVRDNCQQSVDKAPVQGPPGPPGYPGATGPSGPPGMPGNHGNNGINGLSGRDGRQGDKGSKGEQGFPGVSGMPGVPGPRGDEGGRGQSGADGNMGLAGPTGKPGTPGRQGPIGDQGIPGIEGPQGPRGYTGDPGDPGPRGDDGVCNCETQSQQRYAASGTSAFSVARTSGLTATDGPVTVTFQHVFVNVGDNFDINTGKFNCSIPGLYFFTINIYKSSSTNFPLVQLLLNGEHQAAVIDYGSSDTEDSTTNSVILSLNLNDLVWLQLYDGRELYSSHYRFTTFSGFRIG